MTSSPLPLSWKQLLLGGVFVLLAGILVFRWVSGWGLVTIHVKDAPLETVLKSIARQGNVRIETSLAASNTLSLDVDQLTPAAALDIVSVRTDADLRMVYLAASTRGELGAAIASLQGTGKIVGWASHFYQGPTISGAEGADPRKLELRIEGPEVQLPLLLDQAAQKTGLMTGSPESWSPIVPKLPKPATADKTLRSLVASAHGQVIDFFFLTKQDWRNQASDGQGQQAGGEESQRQPRMKPEWREERSLAQINQLPRGARPAAKKTADEMNALFRQMQGLSPQERRAKWQELMANPDNQDRGDERRLLRDAKASVDQRVTRAVSYLTKKASVQAAQAAKASGSTQ